MVREKLKKMFGDSLVEEWDRDIMQLETVFVEFINNTREISFFEFIKKATKEEDAFKDIKNLSPEKINELYRMDEDMVVHCLYHYPFQAEQVANDIVENIHNKNMKILDFGASVGNDLFWLENRGFTNLHHYEINELAKLFARYRARVYGSGINILDELEDDYDVIMSFDVIEHIPNYKEVFEDLFKKMKPKSTFYIGAHFTPKDSPGRITHFEENYPMEKLFEENGFKKINNLIWRRGYEDN